MATASSKLPITYVSKTTKVCTVSKGVASLLIEGACSIEATQAGNATYTAAAAVTRSFTVHLASQKITFAAVKTPVDTLTTVKLTATASSKLPVKLASVTPKVCTVAAGGASLLTEGTCTIKATQAGNNVYAAAPAITQSFAVSGHSQTISFPTIANQTVGASVTLKATASSGLAVAFASTTTTVCTVTGTKATMVTAGNCTIKATQPGNSVYAAAPAVTSTFKVTQ